MKKISWMVCAILVMVLAMNMPALAATTAANINGKTYVFPDGQTTWEVDGMTLTIEGNTIRVQEPGKADRVLPLERASESIATEDAVSSGNDVASAVASEGTLSAGTAARNTVAISAIDTMIVEESVIDPSTYDVYAPYGLRYDAESNALYYQGSRVRIFEDMYFENVGSVSALTHFDPEGVVDVEPLRDYTAGSTLTGLRALTTTEFTSRDMTGWLAVGNDMPTASASEGAPMTPAEKQAMYAPYAAYGLVYDASLDKLTYEGQSIRQFLDVKQSNGESFSGGQFVGLMTMMNNGYGEVDVTVLRDYTRPDAEGNGTITGIDVQSAK